MTDLKNRKCSCYVRILDIYSWKNVCFCKIKYSNKLEISLGTLLGNLSKELTKYWT